MNRFFKLNEYGPMSYNIQVTGVAAASFNKKTPTTIQTGNRGLLAKVLEYVQNGTLIETDINGTPLSEVPDVQNAYVKQSGPKSYAKYGQPQPAPRPVYVAPPQTPPAPREPAASPENTVSVKEVEAVDFDDDPEIRAFEAKKNQLKVNHNEAAEIG